MKPPYKKTREPRGILLACFTGLTALAVEIQDRLKCAVAILREGEMPRARRVKKVAQEGLEIHLRVPRLHPGPSPKVKHRQMLFFHAEAKGLAPGGLSKGRRSIFRFVFCMLELQCSYASPFMVQGSLGECSRRTAPLGTFLEQVCSGTRVRNRSISRNIFGKIPEHFRKMRVRIGVPPM